ncbi:hypothetical protein BJ322DRAFT_1056413 [Thelephora terrestris]|uniref:RING-type domain-containing protein n=1 Tax=Thelephora terrestris TaxID=56493 RepID=A0A9P6HEW3_9AGAM|nr:hypothetical protein BJ322DRAFT_1056413 [Thelephora terrestris]
MPPNSDPMWYCHECGSEMRPLMVPDPHCASCNGTFVEMVESPEDDPRAWQNTRPGDDGDFDDLTAQLRDVFPGQRPSGRGLTLAINRSSSPSRNTRTFVFGRPGQTEIGPDRVMPLTEFLEETAGDGGWRAMREGSGPGGEIPQEFMMNQILGMLARRYTDRGGSGAGGPNPFAELLGMHQGGSEAGRLGDYVLNQQALDQIMTALMENSNAHRPVPATEQIIDRLDHEVLEEGSPLLEKGCAVCKDQFSLQTEDPDEQVVITLPCKHPFHSPCILPWLKQNGTCPTCRHQLAPQPSSTSSTNDSSASGPLPSASTSNPPRPTPFTNPWTQPRNDSSPSNSSASYRNRGHVETPDRTDSGGLLGMFGNLLHSFGGGHQTPGPEPSSSDSGPDTLPGSWEPDPSSRPEFGNRSPQTRSSLNRPLGGTHTSSGPRRSQTTPFHDRQDAPLSTSANSRDPRGDPTSERNSQNPGSYRRGGHDRERERRRDRNNQRRNTHSWDNPDLD